MRGLPETLSRGCGRGREREAHDDGKQECGDEEAGSRHGGLPGVQDRPQTLAPVAHCQGMPEVDCGPIRQALRVTTRVCAN